MKLSLGNKKGQGLVSVLIAGGIGAVVLGFITDMMVQQGIGQKFLTQKLEINDLTANLMTTFAKANNCSCQFADNAAVTPTPDFIITPGGNIGIRLANPTNPLQVEGNPAIRGQNTGTGAVGLLARNDWGVYCLAGRCGGTSNWINDSDVRLKTNMIPIKNALDKILQLEGIYYDWKDKSKNTEQGKKIGLIAQKVERVFPEAVYTDKSTPESLEGGTKMLAYAELVAPLIQALKEFYSLWFEDSKFLKQEISQLKNENRELRQALCENNPKLNFCRTLNK